MNNLLSNILISCVILITIWEKLIILESEIKVLITDTNINDKYELIY